MDLTESFTAPSLFNSTSLQWLMTGFFEVELVTNLAFQGCFWAKKMQVFLFFKESILKC